MRAGRTMVGAAAASSAVASAGMRRGGGTPQRLLAPVSAPGRAGYPPSGVPARRTSPASGRRRASRARSGTRCNQAAGPGELYYPDLGTAPRPASLKLRAVVGPLGAKAVKGCPMNATHRTTLADATSLTYRENRTTARRPRLAARQRTYVTDPQRSSMQVDVRFVAHQSGSYRLLRPLRADPVEQRPVPTIAGGSEGCRRLVASDAHAASALGSATPAFRGHLNRLPAARATAGTDLSDKRTAMDWH